MQLHNQLLEKEKLLIEKTVLNNLLSDNSIIIGDVTITKLKGTKSSFEHNQTQAASGNEVIKKHRNNQNRFNEAAKRTKITPTVNGFQDIAGLHKVKQILKMLVILPKQQPQLYEGKTCNSCLLFGPPGTGKTRLVHALAAEANCSLYSISSSDILSSYVGETEKLVSSLTS